MDKPLVIATSVDEIEWTAKIYSKYEGCYVDVKSSPVFNTPEKAIAWGKYFLSWNN